MLFYNEPAEDLLGKRFEDTGPLPLSEWSVIFNPTDDQGLPFPPESMPLVQTLQNHLPAQGSFWIESLLGTRHKISVTSIPLKGRAHRYLGAMAIFWSNESL